jgi:hypothetical protein
MTTQAPPLLQIRDTYGGFHVFILYLIAEKNYLNRNFMYFEVLCKISELNMRYGSVAQNSKFRTATKLLLLILRDKVAKAGVVGSGLTFIPSSKKICQLVQKLLKQKTQ